MAAEASPGSASADGWAYRGLKPTVGLQTAASSGRRLLTPLLEAKTSLSSNRDPLIFGKFGVS